MGIKKISYCCLIIGLLLVLEPTHLNAGSLQYQATTEIEAGLKSGELSEGFNFYYSGSQAEPHTIIGVLKTVAFDQSLWQGTDSSLRTVQGWYEMIDNPHRSPVDQYFGGYILNSAGERIGLWYSRYRYQSAKLNDEGVLSIARPFRKSNMPGRGKRIGRKR